MNRAELITLARTVADLRTQESDIRKYIAEKRNAFNDSLAAEIDLSTALLQRLMDAEAALRAGGLELYRETGDKHPAPGVEVKEKLTLEYDGQIRWTAPQAQLARDMDKALADIPLARQLWEAEKTDQLSHDMEATRGYSERMEKQP